MPTIKDVAKLAGVSVGTVSKALNDYSNISDETKLKVKKAAEDLNYVPNIAAASLASKKQNKIALIISVNNQRQAIDEINMQYIMGATEQANKLGCITSIVFTSTLEGMNETQIISDFKSRGFNALIMYGISKEHYVLHNIIKKETFKTVVVDSDFVNESTSCVTVDHYNGQKDVIRGLFDENPLDYKPSLLYIAGGVEGYVTEIRQKAVIDLQEELNFDLKIVNGNFSESMAFDIVGKNIIGTDYIACASDLMAIGAMHKLQEIDVFKPICGYDGISLMGYAAQNMLTCVQDFYHVSEIAMQEVKSLLDGNESSIKLINYEIRYFNYKDVIF